MKFPGLLTHMLIPYELTFRNSAGDTPIVSDFKKEAVEALAQNHTKKAKNERSLLHICDAKKGERKTKEIIPLFSTN